MAEKERVVIFQGTGYRILAMDRYNVKLEVQNDGKNYVFVGYYANIESALRAIVRKDMLLDRKATQDAKSYLLEITSAKETILNDIEAHFVADDDELFN